jgi:alpha-tubulin suppressor-like RCC1 family protein
MFHACAVTKAGKAYCWGTNMQGELGIGDGTPKDALPNEITSLGSDVVSIWAGWETTCAIMKNGGLKCWGDDDDESVGDGQSDILRKVTSPVDVIGLGPGSGVTLVAPSENKTTCAVANGAAKCWGKSHALGLAQGRDYETYQPNGNVQTLDANVAEVAVGTGYACARLRDGSVKCWGGGDSGQLGHGPTEGMGQVFEEKPVPVLSLP